jgi:DNA invertase Pin-like site-specific DNA recombinase
MEGISGFGIAYSGLRNTIVCGFVSLQENIDTTNSGGKLVFHVFGALTKFERELITDRTNAGIASARSRGRWAADRK